MSEGKISDHNERLSRLPECRRETLMGQLLRRFWHPVARSEAVASGQAKGIRALGETFALYRGASGNLHLVDGVCPHRRTLLHTGWVQGENLRCMYHGWQFDSRGQCIDRPAEDPLKNASIKIGSYPVKEYAGLVFAYLGAGEAPAFDLPRKEPFESNDMMIFAREETWPCNWFQQVEIHSTRFM